MMTQAGFLAESLFRVFDEDNSGALSFYEFAQVLVVIVCHCLSLFVCTGGPCSDDQNLDYVLVNGDGYKQN